MVARKTELWFNVCMLKTQAIQLLGGTFSAAAKAIGISYQAVHKWPDVLPESIADRVVAAVARKHLPPELIGNDSAPAPGPEQQQAA
jgi:hypothetical protein